MKKYFQKNSRNSKQKWGAFIFAFWIFAVGAFMPIAISKLNPTINYAHADTLVTATVTVSLQELQNNASISAGSTDPNGQITNTGSGYTTSPSVSIEGITGCTPTASTTISDGSLDSITFHGGSSACAGIPIITIAPPTPATATSTTDTPPAITPACGVTGWGQVLGCISNIFYLFFYISNAVAGWAASFLDWTAFHSIEDTMYRIPFVQNGWGIVRDVSNMAFIFVLLYLGIQMILGMGHGTKKALVTLIISALLINFSLFFTQVIIDSGNILAHTFYNTIPASPNTTVPEGKSLTANLIEKINPQQLMSETLSTSKLALTLWAETKCGASNLSIVYNAFTFQPGNGNTIIENTITCIKQAIADGNVSFDLTVAQNEQYILVTLLATGVNVALIFVFFSVGFMLLGRIIGLIFAMIVSPLAFVSKVIPGFANMAYIGFDKWMKDLLGLAFLPGVFLFFMYLIIKFINLPQNNVQGVGGLNFVLMTIIPIIFILVLVMIAKNVAKSMAGDVGGMIGGMIGKITAVAGGLALGATALGVAAVGRGTVGAVTKYTQNDEARKKALGFQGAKDAADKWRWYNPVSYGKVITSGFKSVGSAATAGIATGLVGRADKKVRNDVAQNMLGVNFKQASKPDKQVIKDLIASDRKTGTLQENWYKRMPAAAGEKIHATHVLDEAAQKFTGNKETKFKDLDESASTAVKDKINKDIAAKERFGTVYDKLKPPQLATLTTENNNIHGGSWEQHAHSYEAGAKAQGRTIHTANHLVSATKADVAVSEFVNALRKGSYDVRNLSGVKSNTTGLTKMGVGLIAGVAAGVRTGLKSGGINHGVGQKDIFKDLGSTLKTAIEEGFKSFKVNISVPKTNVDAGGHDVHGDHGGGHH